MMLTRTLVLGAMLLALGATTFRSVSAADPLDNVLLLDLRTGRVTILLRPDLAPKHVERVKQLTRGGFYNGIVFHRVIPGFMAQTGDPTGTGLGGPGYYIPNEIVPELKYDAEGVVGMANAGPDTNGSQFFITMAPAPELDGQYTIFGKVVKGMEVVRALSLRNPQQDPESPPGDKIITVKIDEQ